MSGAQLAGPQSMGQGPGGCTTSVLVTLGGLVQAIIVCRVDLLPLLYCICPTSRMPVEHVSINLTMQ